MQLSIIKLLRVNTLWVEPHKKIIEFKLNFFIESSKSSFNISKIVIIFMKTMNVILFISIIEILFEKN
jgi:hypothetical protein